MSNPTIDLKRNAEAARYALLRRLAPALRHQLAGGLQPLTLMTALLEKRLKAVTPDLPAITKTSSDVRTMASAASRSSLDLMGWIAPDPDALVPLDKGIHDALHMVATELSFRGFTFNHQTQDMAGEVALGQVLGVFVAAVLALTDAATAPASLEVTALRDGQSAVVSITLTEANTAACATAPREAFQLSLAAYRNIDWGDVDAMALSDGVVVQHTSNHVVMHFPAAAV